MGIMDVPRGKEFHQHRLHATCIVSAVVQWVKDAWNTVPDRIIISGFIKAEILDMPEQPTEDEEMPLDDEDDLPLALATLFHSDIEDSMGLCRTELYYC